ncbi:hypothetical protein TELCIR_21903 [Teladorsagia circumcincta]|uniref:SHSP domain-containing protein n=1 Tax=Teladorsagia circumcincta TaxID=45464 RepID=A0A2G9TFF1_TELCI|nr:hypothetical protein TELCIR_21903 [Teladorsagia circumcincta]
MARSFMRSWTLPEDVKLEEVKSELTDKGRLTIEVPKYPDPSYRKDYKEIPIEHRGSSSSQSRSTHTYTHSRSGH